MAPSVMRNTVASVGESIGGADTTSVFVTVDIEVEVSNTGNVIQVNLIHTFDYKIHHSYII